MKKKRIFTAIVLTAACFVAGIATLHAETTSVKAADLTYATFQMENGASVRVKDETIETVNADGSITTTAYSTNGMRFTAEIGQSEYDALIEAGAEFGMLVVANDLIGGNESKLTKENVFGENGLFYFWETAESGKIPMRKVRAVAENLDTDENIEIWGAITNINVSNFTRPFVGRAYVAIPKTTETVNGETVVTEYEYQFASFYENDMQNNSRCMYYVAQRAIEDGISADVLNEKYITAYQTKYPAVADGTRKYKYNVVHHYPQTNADGSEKTDDYGTVIYDTETEVCGGMLNTTVTVESATTPKEGYVFDDIKTANRNTGLVYAAGMQTLNVYYRVETDAEASGSGTGEGSGSGSEESGGTTQKSVSELLSAADASTKYFGGTLAYNEDGELVSVDTEEGLAALTGGGQTAVVFTAQFLYDLQQNGYSTITIGKLWSTPTNEIGGFASTQEIALTGYVSGTEYEFTRSGGKIANETVTDESGNELTRTYITEPITIKLEQTIYYKEDDAQGIYYYLDEAYTTEAQSIAIQCYGYFGAAAVGRDWVFDHLTIT